jgi:hypothetical protein
MNSAARQRRPLGRGNSPNVEGDSMKRLFQVNGSFFEAKETAKMARGKFTPAEKGSNVPGKYEFEVTKGPDHIRYVGAMPSENGYKATKRKHKAKHDADDGGSN